MRVLLLVIPGLLVGCTSADEWTDEREQEAIGECQRLVAYQSDACFAAAFCQCAVPDYKRRGDSYTALRGKLHAVAGFGKRGAWGYYCTDTAESRCPASR
jgi:hypothetical protein